MFITLLHINNGMSHGNANFSMKWDFLRRSLWEPMQLETVAEKLKEKFPLLWHFKVSVEKFGSTLNSVFFSVNVFPHLLAHLFLLPPLTQHVCLSSQITLEPLTEDFVCWDYFNTEKRSPQPSQGGVSPRLAEAEYRVPTSGERTDSAI